MNSHVNAIPKEARPFQGQRAGLVTRVAAAGVDAAVVAVGLLAAYLGLVAVVFLFSRSDFEVPRPAVWIDVGVGTVLMTLYLATAWHGGGRTYGCLVMGLRVVDRHGRSPGWVTALLRALLTVAFPLGVVWVAVSRTNRSVQDLVLRTSVIYAWDVRPR